MALVRSRRDFLGAGLGAAAALGWPRSGSASVLPGAGPGVRPQRPQFPQPKVSWRGDSSVAAALRAGVPLDTQAGPLRRAAAVRPGQPLVQRFRALQHHFIYEYYPWYGGPPGYEHWDYLDRRPPDDLAAAYVPRLGAYDVASRAVLEQHARWIADSGVGSIALSWWGRGSYEDRQAHAVMDVMKEHGIKVTFGLEPYADDRSRRYAEDILYLLREYGERRGYDCLLILHNDDGSQGPIFKGFRCVLPPEVTDCHGRRIAVSDYTPDDVWRQQIETLRGALRLEFDHVTLLADSLEFARTPASGFDGIGIYDNFIAPASYAALAAGASRRGLLFSFNVNPGYDQIEPREVEPGSCYAPRPFAPATDPIDWSLSEERERAALAAQQRIRDSFAAALAVQQDPSLTNGTRGFFAVYVNSFNEWHEGHSFEPMRDAAELSPGERRFLYHNPARGDGRLVTLARLMRDTLASRQDSHDLLAAAGAR